MTSPARSVLFMTAILGILSMLGPVGVDMFVAFIPKIADGLQSDPNTVAQSVPAFMLGSAAGLLFHGALSDRFGRKPIIMAILGLYTISAFAAANAGSVEALILWRFVQGIATSGGRVLANSVARDLYEREQLARAMSGIMGVSAIGAIIFPTVGGHLAQLVPWPVSFMVMAGFGLMVVLIFVFGFRETIAQRDAHALDPASLWANTVEICRNRTFILQTAMTSLSLSGFVAYLSTSPTILIGSFGVGEGNFGLLFSVISASFATATFICGRVVTRFGLPPLIGLGSVLSLIGGAMMAGFALNDVDTVAAVVGSMAVYIVGMALILPQAQAAGLQPFPATAGLASSIMGFVNAVFASAVSVTLNTFPNTDAVPVGVALAAAGTLCSVVFFLGIVPNLRRRSRT